jgi:hypothetical protein
LDPPKGKVTLLLNALLFHYNWENPQLGQPSVNPYNALGQGLQFYCPSNMRFFFQFALSIALKVRLLAPLSAQYLAPRAFLTLPSMQTQSR